MPKFTREELIETFARLEHEQWITWASSIMDEENLSEERVERWRKECFVPYESLSEELKNHDRKWATAFVHMLEALDIIHYANVAEPLWDILDDIDTLSDMMHPAKTAFYEAVMSRVANRFKYLESDGYIVYPPGEKPERTYIEAAREGEPKYKGSVGYVCGQGKPDDESHMFKAQAIGHSDMLGATIKEGDIIVDADGSLFTIRYISEHSGFFRLPEGVPDVPQRFEDYQSNSFVIVGSVYNDGYCITTQGQQVIDLFKKFVPNCKLQDGKCADCEVADTCKLIRTVINTPLVDSAEIIFSIKGT